MEFQFLPEQASTVAASVDALYFFLLAVSGFMTVLIASLVVYFAIRFRRKVNSVASVRPHADLLTLEVAWIVVPLVFAMIFFGWGAALFVHNSRPPEDAMEIYIVGKQWMWKAQHPGGRSEINELHVPIGRPVKLIMISEDVIHSYFIPAFRVKMDVLPGRYTTMWFEANRPGQYHLFCAEYCGTKHSEMRGRVVVMEPAAYQRWLSEGFEMPTVAMTGEELFAQLRCDSCHGVQDDPARGPSLHGRFGLPVALENGRTTTFDEAHIREKIRSPRAKRTAGYPDIMPTYAGLIDESEMISLIAYLKSLSATTAGPNS